MIRQPLLLFSLFCMTFVLVLTTRAQRAVDPDEVIVKSWKKGKEKITHQVIQAILSPKMSEFEKEILAISGKRYRLRIVQNPDKTLKGEHWQVEFREVVLGVRKKEILSEDLLYRDKPGDSGGDSFSRDRFASIFYPYQENRLIVGGLPLIEWNAFYPTETIRKFLVDGFCLVIKSGKVEFSEKDKTKIKIFELDIEFTNTVAGGSVVRK